MRRPIFDTGYQVMYESAMEWNETERNKMEWNALTLSFGKVEH